MARLALREHASRGITTRSSLYWLDGTRERPPAPQSFDFTKNKLRKGLVLLHTCSPLCSAFKPNAIVPFFCLFPFLDPLQRWFYPLLRFLSFSFFLSSFSPTPDGIVAVKRRNNDKSVLSQRKEKEFLVVARPRTDCSCLVVKPRHERSVLLFRYLRTDFHRFLFSWKRLSATLFRSIIGSKRDKQVMGGEKTSRGRVHLGVDRWWKCLMKREIKTIGMSRLMARTMTKKLLPSLCSFQFILLTQQNNIKNIAIAIT